jgi:hypothetical protein
MDWRNFSDSIHEDEYGRLVLALKALAANPTELALIEMEDVRSLAARGLLRKRTKPALIQFFDNWSMIALRARISEADVRLLRDVAAQPSHLLDADEDDLAGIDLKPLAKRRVLRCVSELLDKSLWKELPTLTETDDGTAQNSATAAPQVAAPQTAFLFGTLLTNANGHCVSSPETLLDEKFSRFVAVGQTTTPTRLVTTHARAGVNIEAVDFSMGTIMDLSPIVAMVGDPTKMLANVEFIDLSINRVEAAQWNNLCVLLDTVSQTNGALVIVGNPIASTDAKDKFEDLALTQPGKLLRLIWIPKSWLEAGHWKNLLGKNVSQALIDSVYDAHVAFYTHLARLRRSPAFPRLEAHKLRIFKD